MLAAAPAHRRYANGESIIPAPGQASLAADAGAASAFSTTTLLAVLVVIAAVAGAWYTAQTN